MFGLLLNFILMTLFWVWAVDYFQKDQNIQGWFNLVMSALSGALILIYLF
jgi:RsiW-degrading membrane proteinase PrsW (M82 family)